jgi:hypothetical protein
MGNRNATGGLTDKLWPAGPLLPDRLWPAGFMLVESQFGSHLYGTQTPDSDLDIKGVYVPRGRDLILQQAPATSQTYKTKIGSGRNTSADVDAEYFTLQAFIDQLDKGEMQALDLLFAPRSFWCVSTNIWEEIQSNRSRLLHRSATPFIEYCKKQAAKYGLKGSYIAALKGVLEVLSGLNDTDRLWQYGSSDREVLKTIEHVSFIRIQNPKLNNSTEYLQVRGIKVDLNATVSYARKIFQKQLDVYGERARKAEQNDGVDWKAISHAIRACWQAEELLLTGFITFPLPRASELVRIKQGLVPYREAEEMIERGVERVKTAETRSALPERIDLAFWEDFVVTHYGKVIQGELRACGKLS